MLIQLSPTPECVEGNRFNRFIINDYEETITVPSDEIFITTLRGWKKYLLKKILNL